MVTSLVAQYKEKTASGHFSLTDRDTIRQLGLAYSPLYSDWSLQAMAPLEG